MLLIIIQNNLILRIRAITQKTERQQKRRIPQNTPFFLIKQFFINSFGRKKQTDLFNGNIRNKLPDRRNLSVHAKTRQHGNRSSVFHKIQVPAYDLYNPFTMFLNKLTVIKEINVHGTAASSQPVTRRHPKTFFPQNAEPQIFPTLQIKTIPNASFLKKQKRIFQKMTMARLAYR